MEPYCFPGGISVLVDSSHPASIHEQSEKKICLTETTTEINQPSPAGADATSNDHRGNQLSLKHRHQGIETFAPIWEQHGIKFLENAYDHPFRQTRYQGMKPDEMTDITKEKLDSLTTTAQNKAKEALQASQSYAKENPMVLAVGALIFGIAIGALCSTNREPKRKQSGKAARALVDDIVSQVSHRLNEFKKQSNCSPSSLLEQVQGTGKKLKWW